MITKKFLHTFNLLGPQMYVPSLKSIDEIAWDIFLHQYAFEAMSGMASAKYH